MFCRRQRQSSPSSHELLSPMNYDRKSTVSSIYGEGKRSTEPLNTGRAQQSSRGRGDSSSFFPGESNSMDHITASRPSAGYNKGSFHLAGREEPVRGGPDEAQKYGEGEVWDVFADFNNTGPRYSSAFGIGQSQTQAG